MGFAINRTTWREIVNCSEYFCTYDDYNWDWTLAHVSQECLSKKLFAMVPKTPRAFHIGEWFVPLFNWWHSKFELLLKYSISLLNCSGLHHDKNNCNPELVINKIQRIFEQSTKSHQFYPEELQLSPPTILNAPRLYDSNGGWGDTRDHSLCLKFVGANTNDVR